MTPGRRAGPSLVALLGWPVTHSLSPVIHDAAFRELGLDAVYAALAVREEELGGVLPAVARSGGGNVTVPHKEAVARELDRPSDLVRRTGACNCFWWEEGELAGDNTDVDSFRAFVEAWPAARLGSGRVLLLGAGGAARAVAAACQDAGVRSLEIWNRTTERARVLARDTGDGPPETELRVLPSRSDAHGRYDLVVNATSLGLDPDGDPLPLQLDGLEVGAVCDLVYGDSTGTPWTRHARALGIPARDGLEMLVRQAGLSLEKWFAVEAPLDVMRRAARAAAGREEG